MKNELAPHMSGSLSTLSVVDLLQMVAAPERNGVIRITTKDGATHQIRLVGETIVNAQDLDLVTLINEGESFTYRSVRAIPSGTCAVSVEIALLTALSKMN
jgi:hypothetical protein